MARQGRKATAGRKAQSRGQSTAKNSRSNTSAEEMGTLEGARSFVSDNLTWQTAGIALAGAGVLALVSTAAGRNLIKAGSDAVVGLVTSLIPMGESADESVHEEIGMSAKRKPAKSFAKDLPNSRYRSQI